MQGKIILFQVRFFIFFNGLDPITYLEYISKSKKYICSANIHAKAMGATTQ